MIESFTFYWNATRVMAHPTKSSMYFIAERSWL